MVFYIDSGSNNDDVTLQCQARDCFLVCRIDCRLYATATDILLVSLPPDMARRMSCGACRAQRKKCAEECVLAQHFPPDDPLKFAIVQKVFGTKNIIKLLQVVEADQRGDAVSSMLYEASARVNDPIYGCTAEVYKLQKEIAELKSQLVAIHAELNYVRSQYGKFVFLLGTGSLDDSNRCHINTKGSYHL
ncbi:LOB domain-containing protein 4-like [Cryptomeria japonica]|uniref:LOB domain-containing protein 4-like n=1 Tax=Cryptomeria japonica TaxID=3369 RepID=UPI0027DA773D|nr:LOB domain-containing protein 4-like [Cryptomeria japonica]